MADWSRYRPYVASFAVLLNDFMSHLLVRFFINLSARLLSSQTTDAWEQATARQLLIWVSTGREFNPGPRLSLLCHVLTHRYTLDQLDNIDQCDWCRYGPQAGQVAQDISYSAYHVGQTGVSVMSLRKMGVTTVARRVAKRTAKGLTKSYVLGKPPPGECQCLCKSAPVLAFEMLCMSCVSQCWDF